MMSMMDFYKKGRNTRMDSEDISYAQKINDKEQTTRHILGFLSKETRKRILEHAKLELGLQADTSGDRYTRYHS